MDELAYASMLLYRALLSLQELNRILCDRLEEKMKVRGSHNTCCRTRASCGPVHCWPQAAAF